MKRLVLVVVLLLLCATLTSCSGEPAPAATDDHIPTITVIHPQRGDAVLSINLPGDLVGFYEAALHAKVTGYLSHVYVDKGDWVKKGQVLADIEVPELNQNLDRARANLDMQRLTYERLKRVRDTDQRLVAQEDVDIAASKWQQAKAESGALETLVNYTKIIAPFDGVITGRFADPGALIRAGGGDIGLDATAADVSSGATEGAGGHRSGGGPILTLADIDKLRTYVYVPEQETPLIRRGMPAKLTFKEFPGRTFEGQVTRYATSLDLSTRTMLTEIDIDNPTRRLYPRMYATVTLELEQHPNALELPAGAVDQSRAEPIVLTVRDGVLTRVPVQTGIENGRSIEITSGLSTGDEVVATYSPGLSEGQRVRPVALAAQLQDGRVPAASSD
ncbi:MAG TPA: efflux RND transporter periplasmic adaptor subunit [Candidatus Binataceae bacterium]|nr:efflux RND transporter periplasmic adaptor subunit [Candidatus Binataceae bacterium]